MAEKNGLKNWGTFFNTLYVTEEKENKFRYLFVGQDKGRKAQIESLDMQLKEAGIERGYVNICGPGTILYPDYLDLVSQSECIIDILQKGQNGLTLRPFEAMYFNKKLITNSREIVDFDFYNPSNIYVLGYDKRSLVEFFSEKSTPVDGKIKHKYSLEGWIERIIGEHV